MAYKCKKMCLTSVAVGEMPMKKPNAILLYLTRTAPHKRLPTPSFREDGQNRSSRAGSGNRYTRFVSLFDNIS